MPLKWTTMDLLAWGNIVLRFAFWSCLSWGLVSEAVCPGVWSLKLCPLGFALWSCVPWGFALWSCVPWGFALWSCVPWGFGLWSCVPWCLVSEAVCPGVWSLKLCALVFGLWSCVPWGLLSEAVCPGVWSLKLCALGFALWSCVPWGFGLWSCVPWGFALWSCVPWCLVSEAVSPGVWSLKLCPSPPNPRSPLSCSPWSRLEPLGPVEHLLGDLRQGAEGQETNVPEVLHHRALSGTSRGASEVWENRLSRYHPPTGTQTMKTPIMAAHSSHVWRDDQGRS